MLLDKKELDENELDKSELRRKCTRRNVTGPIYIYVNTYILYFCLQLYKILELEQKQITFLVGLKSRT